MIRSLMSPRYTFVSDKQGSALLWVNTYTYFSKKWEYFCIIYIASEMQNETSTWMMQELEYKPLNVTFYHSVIFFSPK